MKQSAHSSKTSLRLLSLIASAALSACGGGGSSDTATTTGPSAAPLASASTQLTVEMPALPADIATQTVEPAFHVAPLALEAPDDTDQPGDNASARQYPHMQRLNGELGRLSSRHLTVQAIEAVRRVQAVGIQNVQEQPPQLTPMATGGTVVTYTPAQIRAAYGMPSLPASGATPTATQAAQMGAGQTIYVVAAYHDPNIAAELAAFNKKFALPTCTTKAIASLPLTTASASTCELSVVSATTSGTRANSTPQYNASWATEIALDVQWAHATAPLARIVVVEAPDSALDSLVGAIKLANAMGPGVVSMSFGVSEGSWTTSVESAFSGSAMTYLAATGDSGASVEWPAVSPKVVAVGGTTLSYSGSGPRSEIGWSDSGGGTSLYTAPPAYQTNAVPGMGTVARRTVADVAFNADPTSGQYVAILPPGSTTPNWVSAGGTSLATPQWAGLMAVANATRALSSKPPLGAPHAVLYNQIAAVPGAFASAFADIVQGANGNCATCSAHSGYDTLSGLGTPNASQLVSLLSGSTAVSASAPTITPATVTGTAGTPLTFTVSVSASNALSYTLSGAPSGMTINSNGVVSWTTPIAGSYSVTVIARDPQTGLSGQGVYTLKIAAPQSPIMTGVAITGAIVSGKPGTPLSFPVSVTSLHAVTYALGGAPAGMSIGSSGIVSWPKPVLGTYPVNVTVKDTKTGQTAQATYTVKISTAAGPAITASGATGVAGKTLTGTIDITDSRASYVSVSISGAPLGMQFSLSGQTIRYTWPNPLTGTYTLNVSAVDSAGLSAQASIPIKVTAK